MSAESGAGGDTGADGGADGGERAWLVNPRRPGVAGIWACCARGTWRLARAVTTAWRGGRVNGGNAARVAGTVTAGTGRMPGARARIEGSGKCGAAGTKTMCMAVSAGRGGACLTRNGKPNAAMQAMCIAATASTIGKRKPGRSVGSAPQREAGRTLASASMHTQCPCSAAESPVSVPSGENVLRVSQSFQSGGLQRPCIPLDMRVPRPLNGSCMTPRKMP